MSEDDLSESAEVPHQIGWGTSANLLDRSPERNSLIFSMHL
jgi:hypothetical protein